MVAAFNTRLHRINYLLLYISWLQLLFLTINSKTLQAHHLRAGDVTAELVSCQSNTYLFTITGYTDTRVSLEFGYDLVDFGDGTFVNLDTCKDVVKKDLGENITVKVFKIEHIPSELFGLKMKGYVKVYNVLQEKDYEYEKLTYDSTRLSKSMVLPLKIKPVNKNERTTILIIYKAVGYVNEGLNFKSLDGVRSSNVGNNGILSRALPR